MYDILPKELKGKKFLFKVGNTRKISGIVENFYYNKYETMVVLVDPEIFIAEKVIKCYKHIKQLKYLQDNIPMVRYLNCLTCHDKKVKNIIVLRNPNNSMDIKLISINDVSLVSKYGVDMRTWPIAVALLADGLEGKPTQLDQSKFLENIVQKRGSKKELVITKAWIEELIT